MVIENYLPWTGGTERQLAALAGELQTRHIHVEVMTEQRHPEWPLSEEIAGIQVHRLPYPKVRMLGTVILFFRAAWFLCAYGRRFHVFHVHTVSFLAVLTTLIGRLLGKAIVLKAVGGWELERGVLNPVRRRQLLYRVMLAIVRRAEAWIAISTHLRLAMEAAGIPPEHIVTIPNGVDTDRFAPSPHERPRQPGALERPCVVFVGRLVKEKALPVLLQAWTLVLQQTPGAILEIVGRGPLEHDLKMLSARLGLTAAVRFHGYHEDVIPFLQTAHAFVLPSYVEGLSNTLLEAMALELPVVATRISGSEDIVVDGETGLLVPPNDAAALARAVNEILASPARAALMGQQARLRVMQLCGLEQVISAYVQLYNHLLEKNGVRLCAASQVS
jgi:glycosyltransferase involved in cell wall biosynthesis